MTTVLPTFALGDEDTTRKLTIAYTACACTGFPRQDSEFEFEFEKVTPEQALGRMKTWKPTTDFGETFQYSTTLDFAAAQRADHATPHASALDGTTRMLAL